MENIFYTFLDWLEHFANWKDMGLLIFSSRLETFPKWKFKIGEKKWEKFHCRPFVFSNLTYLSKKNTLNHLIKTYVIVVIKFIEPICCNHKPRGCWKSSSSFSEGDKKWDHWVEDELENTVANICITKLNSL